LLLALRYYRLKLGKTQTELGRAVGIDSSRICDFEHGRRTPNDSQLHRLATALGVSPAFMLLRHVEVTREDIAFRDERASA
jgi:transcriptional regulator with XRE-family HTH domain